MLRNHGPVVLGRTLAEMFLVQWSLQRACEIQLATLAMGEPVRVPDEVVAVHQRDLAQVMLPGGPGAADLAAWTRRLDRIDRGWRD
jgi:ribulose-5-phosphate 4-epimerase/fuculose-1-phosphate aldolase